MISERTMPTIMIVLSLLSAIGYIPSGNWRQVAYWLAAAVLTYTVTY